jgi:hypothetical protein
MSRISKPVSSDLSILIDVSSAKIIVKCEKFIELKRRNWPVKVQYSAFKSVVFPVPFSAVIIFAAFKKSMVTVLYWNKP